jgi:hypothetical protein
MENSELYKGSGSIASLIIAPSGQGKTSSIRNLKPETTYIINVMGKALPFIGAASKYKLGVNMAYIDRAPKIIEEMEKVSKDTKWESLIIDDAQYIIATEFMRQVLVKGYDKFSIMAQNMWNILLTANKLRDGLKVFILTHEETMPNERKMKTLGKLLDEKLTPEGLMTIVLFGGVSRDVSGCKYFFQTQSDGIASAKSPMGMFPYTIPNDLDIVSRRIDEYYAGVPIEESKVEFNDIVTSKKGG